MGWVGQVTTRSYRYRAFTRDGQPTAGVIVAVDMEAATRKLREQVSFIESISPALWQYRRSTAATELATGLRIFATLLRSGLPLSKVLGIFEEVAPRSWRAAWPSIRSRVREGGSFSEALRESSLGIPRDVLGIVAAGDNGVGLIDAVERAATVAEGQARIRKAIKGALAYPLLLLAVGLVTFTVLFTTVLPRFASIIADLGQQPPPLTTVLINVGSFAQNSGFVILCLLGGMALAFQAWVRTEGGLRRFHQFLLQLPAVGSLRLASATSRTLHTLAALIDSGVPVATALVHVAPSSGDAEVGARILTGRTSITRGGSIATSLLDAHAITASAARCLRAGEESGRLSALMRHAAELESSRVEQMLKTLTRLLEPALILFFGLTTAAIAMGLLQAVYAVRPS